MPALPSNIVVATPLSAPDIGGPATYTALLEAELPERGITLAVVSFRDVRSSPKLIRHLRYTCRLWRQSRKADIIFALDPVSVGVPALLVSWMRRKPLLLRVPGDYAWEQARLRFGVEDGLDDFVRQPYHYGLRASVLCWLERLVAKRAQRVIVPSEYMKGVVTRWGVSPARLTRIYSALEPFFVPEARENLRAELGYEGFVLISAARLVPHKGFAMLLRAFKKISDAHEAVTLTVVGSGPEEKALREQVASLGLTEKVRFTGNLEKARLGQHLKAADLFVLNTSYEGLSHQLLEVMALGVPIITTPVGGNTELLTDQQSALLVPYNDEVAWIAAIEKLYQDQPLRQRLAENARQETERFSKIKTIDKLLALLKQI